MDIVFGFGRRICPGRYMAYENLWISIACILAVFDIDKAKDALGRPVPPSGKYVYGFTWCVGFSAPYHRRRPHADRERSHPEPFQCEIKPRSAEHQGWIQQTDVTDL